MPFFDQSNETAPRGAIANAAGRKLQKLLNEISGRNPACTQGNGTTRGSFLAIFSRSTIFQKTPFLTCKSELVARCKEKEPPFGTNADFLSLGRLHTHTPNLGHQPALRCACWDTPESWDWWGYCWGHVLERCGGKLPRRPRVLAILFWPFHRVLGLPVEGANRVGAMMIPGGGWDSIQRLHMMRDLGATVGVAARLPMPCGWRKLRRGGNILTCDRFRCVLSYTQASPARTWPRQKRALKRRGAPKCFDSRAALPEVGAHSFRMRTPARRNSSHRKVSSFGEVIDPQTRPGSGRGGNGRTG